MEITEQRYVPAAGRATFTGAYDRVLAATMREPRWRPRLVAAALAGLAPGATVLDVGAGTGTLALALAQARPDVEIVAVDGDPAVLELARRKPGAARVSRWQEALATALPFPDEHADRVVMSLLLHHLVPEQRRAALGEARRVLRPGGELHIADWGRPTDPIARTGFFAVRLLDGLDATRDHALGRLPAIVAAAGFATAAHGHRVRTALGSIELLHATRPSLEATAGAG